MAKENKIRFNFSFVHYGSILNPEPGKIALDVGNRLCPGVIDHHQPGAENDCAASLVLRYPHYITDHLKGSRSEEITLITHISPDMDAVTSAFFSCHLLLHGHFPRFAKKIGNYVRDIDRGICSRKPDVSVTAYDIFTALCELIRRRAQAENWSKERIWRTRTDQGFSLWRYLISEMKKKPIDLHDLSSLEFPLFYQEARNLLLQDYTDYLDDLKKGIQKEVILPGRNGNAGKADALLVRDPRSLLFRSHARGDTRHSPGGKGFTMLAVNFGNRRYIISVDSLSPYYLKGLGELLDIAETEKRKAQGREQKGDPKPGYNSPDPWYDGRNPFHNYGIVDTPWNGTVLTWEEIVAVIQSYSETHTCGFA